MLSPALRTTSPTNCFFLKNLAEATFGGAVASSQSAVVAVVVAVHFSRSVQIVRVNVVVSVSLIEGLPRLKLVSTFFFRLYVHSQLMIDFFLPDSALLQQEGDRRSHKAQTKPLLPCVALILIVLVMFPLDAASSSSLS